MFTQTTDDINARGRIAAVGGFIQLWLIEIAALTASTLLILSLIIVLTVYNGKTVFSWHGVTLNAIVSILATSSKAAMLLAVEELISQWKWILFCTPRTLLDFERIDSASRGPLGSLAVIWCCKKMSLLHIGSWVVLLSLAIDPFSQQLVQTRLGYTSVDDASTTISRAGRYSQGSRATTGPLSTKHHAFAGADFAMQSAVYFGLGQSREKIIQQSSFTCATGNCSWPTYESLAVCSACANITKYLIRKSSFENFPPIQTFVPMSKTRFQLPNGLFIHNRDGVALYNSPRVSPHTYLMTTFGTGNASQTLRMKQLNTLIWSMSIIRAANSTHSSVIWPDVPIHATECALFYCINKYHNVVQNGDLIQEITPVESLRSPLSWQPENDIGVAISDPTRASSIEFDDYYSYYTRSDLHLVSSETGHAFNISQNAVNGISSYFQQNFATDTTNFPLNDSDSDIDDAGQLNGAYFTLGSELSIPGVLQVFFNSENLSSTFAGLATSMSNTLRDFADDIESDGIGKMQTGKTQVVAVLYTIQWPWITIHGVVIAAGWVFLVTTIRINQRYGQGREAFKSNALAVLSRGSIVYHTIGKTQSMSQMERIARNTEVCLFPKTPTGSQLEPGEFGPS